MLGTAAKSSTRVVASAATLDGTNSANAIAAPKPIGAAIKWQQQWSPRCRLREARPEPVMAGEYVPDHTNPARSGQMLWRSPVAMLTTTAITTAAKTPAPSQRAGP